MSDLVRVAVLGTGLMGAPIARNLLAAGFPVTVWNRTRAKAEALAEAGASVAARPADAVVGVDVVITMLESGPVVRDVVFDQGVAVSMDRSSTVVDMSSIPPQMTRDHAIRLAERGIGHLDAPVSGGTRGAAEGTLAIMVGGEPAEFQRRAHLFAPLGTATYVGPSGSGQIAKLANQIIVGITIGAVSEALLLVSAAGADPAAVRDALRGGFADSRILREHGGRMIARDFEPGGPVRLQLKDLLTAQEAAAELQLRLPLTDAVTAMFQQLATEIGVELDHSSLLLELERINPEHRLGAGEPNPTG